MLFFFFFKQKTAYEMRISDWSSDVCSSDLLPDRKVPEHLQETLAPWLDDSVFNIIQLIYQAKPMEQQFKDYAFGRIAMRRHWDAGLQDMVDTLERDRKSVG